MVALYVLLEDIDDVVFAVGQEDGRPGVIRSNQTSESNATSEFQQRLVNEQVLVSNNDLAEILRSRPLGAHRVSNRCIWKKANSGATYEFESSVVESIDQSEL